MMKTQPNQDTQQVSQNSPSGDRNERMASIQETNEFPNEGLAILYHPSAHLESAQDQIAQLQSIFSQVEVFSDWKDASHFIENHPRSNCSVITYDIDGEAFIQEIFEKPNVLSISVFGTDAQQKSHWSTQYESKITLIKKDLQTITNKISTTRTALQQKSSVLSCPPTLSPIADDSVEKELEVTTDKISTPTVMTALQENNHPFPSVADEIIMDKKDQTSGDLTQDINLMASVDEIKKMFLKECVLIFYHPEAQSESMLRFADQLNKICELRVFTDLNETTDFIEKTSADCCVIASDINGEDLVKKLISKSHIFSICVFFSGSEPEWTKTYEKEIGLIEDKIQVILDKIDREVVQWQAKSSLRLDFPIFSPIFTDYDRSENNYLNTYLTGLPRFSNRAQSKTDFLNISRTLYQGDERNIDKFDKAYQNYSLQDIMSWYTKECFLYKVVNNSLRLAKPDTIYYCRFILKDLEAAIKEHYQQKSKNFNGIVYRATYLPDENWKKLQENQGKDIEMYGFLSTTKIKERVDFFMENGKALITIIVPPLPDDRGQGFAEMTEFSVFKDEEEVLFNIRSRFTILETTTETIEDIEYRHLVLLYGAQNIQNFIHLNNPVIRIEVNNHTQIKCRKCGLDRHMMFANLENTQEYYCYDCIKKNQDLNLAALVSINSQLNANLAIDGMLLKYNEMMKIPFYGHKCEECKNRNVKMRMLCQTCKEAGSEWCNNCFDMSLKCVQAGHKIIIENQPYTFWANKAIEREALQTEEEIHDQGDVFASALDYLRAKKFYKQRLALCANDSFQKGIYSEKLGYIYRGLGKFEKAMKYYLEDLKIAKLLAGDKHSRTAYSYDNIGWIHRQLGQAKEAMECYSIALEIKKEIYGDKHPNIANSYSNIGSLYERLGQLEKAMEYYSNALEIRKAILGDKHVHTAASYSSIASVLKDLGQLEKSIGYYSNALEIGKALYGDKHPATANSYNKIGRVFNDLGQQEKAMECFTKALETYKAIYGDTHPEIALSYSNIATLYVNSKQLEKALEYYLISFEMKKATYKDNHPELATSCNNIGSVYQDLGQLEKAMEYYKQALEIKKVVHGDKHPSISKSYNNIASLYCDLGKLEEAKEYYSNALEIMKIISGDKHPSTATAYNNIGKVCQDLGQIEKALEYFLNGLQITEAVFGEKYAETATLYNNVGSLYYNLGQLEKSMKYYTKALEIRKILYGDKHPETAISYNNIGSVYRVTGQLEKAIEYFTKALEIQKEIHGDKNSEIADFYDNIGASYQSLSQFEKSMEYFTNAFEIRKTIYEEKHPSIAKSYNNIGSLYHDLKQIDKAIEYYLHALEIRKAAYGEKHNDTATSYNNIAAAYKDLGQLEKSLEYFKQGLETQIALFGNNHPDTALFYNNMGTLYGALKQAEKAIECYSKSLEIRLTLHGDKHPAIADSYNNIGSACKAMGQLEKALEHFSNALKIRKLVLGDKHPQTINTYFIIGSLHEDLKQLDKAIENYLCVNETIKATHGDKHPLTAGCYHMIGSVYKELGQFEKAVEYYSNSLEIKKAVFGEQHPQTEKTYKALISAKDSISESK